MATISFSEAELKQFIPGQTVFTWKDFLFSATAKKKGLDSSQYTLEQSTYDNIIILFEKIITPLNTANPNKIQISSGYRSPTVNVAIGGAKKSQHLRGQAVDLKKIGVFTNRDIFNWIYNNTPFDQLIWEKGSLPVAGGGPISEGEPQWVHVSFNPNATPRGEAIYTTDGKTYKPIPGLSAPNDVEPVDGADGDDATTAVNGLGKSNSSQDLNGNQSIDGSPGLDENNFAATFEQIARNTANIEANEVDVTWGKKLNPEEDSDWIGLKQFLLYLTSRFCPQSLFPFVELIPILTLDESTTGETNNEANSNGVVPDGTIPSNLQSNLIWADPNIRDKNKPKNIQKERYKFMPPNPLSRDRASTGARASNDASATSSTGADLFNLDPFKEGIDSLGKASYSGEIVKGQRNIGVRAYGQLVLSPGAFQDVPSKPGAIGFKSLEIKTGNTADMGLSLIKMVLVDVQGNKFTDINSPWSFLYNQRAQSLGGDFYFRYGWQIRVPNPQDSTDPIWNKFWNHPGWKIFDDGTSNGIKRKIMNQIIPGKQCITLTQSLNAPSNPDNYTVPTSLFDEGISFEEIGDTVKVSRAILAQPDQNYVRICLQNPEMTMDEHGALIATLNFRTTGSLVFRLPIEYAISTKRLFTDRSEVSLGDLLVAVQNDVTQFGFKALEDQDLKTRQSYVARALALNQAKNTRNFDNFVLVQGPDSGVFGNIHPDDINIKVEGTHMQLLLNSPNASGVTILRWFGEVLQENDCQLLSAATGSGAGINASWIITTTQKPSENSTVKKSNNPNTRTVSDQTLDVFRTEKDVFSYRFQGSLVSMMKVEKTETPNALKIQADYDLAGLADNSVGPDNKPIPLSSQARKNNLINIFQQMLNVNIECLAMPWIGPHKRIFVKGMGFFDGEYQVMEVTHKLDGHKFISQIVGTRTLLQNEEKKMEDKNISSINGRSNFATPVTLQSDTSTRQRNEIISHSKITEINNWAGLNPVAPPPVQDQTPVTTASSNTNNGVLKYMSVNDANLRLGILTDNLVTTTIYSPDVLRVTKACLCEMRKGKGIDTNWFAPDVKSSIDQLLLSLDNKALTLTPAEITTETTAGSLINQKYIVTTLINKANVTFTLGS